MYDKIERMLKDKEFNNGQYIQRYNIDDLELEEAINQLFIDNGFNDCNFNVETDTLFDSCSYETGYCAIAWIENNQLYTYNFQWEVR